MLKGGFEVVNRALDMTPPHELWDASGFSNPASARCAGSERNELSEWVEQVTKQLIDDLPETPRAGADRAFHANSEMASEDCVQSIIGDLRPRKAALRWNVIHHHLESNSNSIQSVNEASPSDSNGLGLLTLLLECAVAISVDNLGEAHRMLLELTQMASPYGPSCAERIVAYFAKAMSSRVINSWLGICSPLVDYKSVHAAFQVFNNVSPFVKFAHFTSNQAILEAFHRRDQVHIIDLDIMQGLQWPALFHILATRIEGPPHMRMTGMGASMELLVETGRQLSNFAKRLGMSFEFHPVARKFGEIVDLPHAVQLRRGETLAVHWLQHSLYDATGHDWKLMRLLEELAPRVITLVEQDVSHGGSFLDRFVGSLHYYSTLFDSLGACLPCDDPSRHWVEHGLMHREINNILAIGGPGRSGEDKFRSWRSELLGRSGSFMQIPMSANSLAQAQLILNMFPPAQGYSLVQGDGTLRLGWKDTSLYTASAWTSIACHHT
ncbi:protein SCARECROW-like [Rhodamnia argentea]|uniref:Protein SCARECROW-like n=1 Tax=Rhodamnia argentea TaxID=178133 RepID=A0ABM3HQQ8_9MYRT|nr:protein SCARECROW-like [Rhodamnia argentea]